MYLNKILRLNRHTAFANKVFSFMIDNKIYQIFIYINFLHRLFRFTKIIYSSYIRPLYQLAPFLDLNQMSAPVCNADSPLNSSPISYVDHNSQTCNTLLMFTSWHLVIFATVIPPQHSTK